MAAGHWPETPRQRDSLINCLSVFLGVLRLFQPSETLVELAMRKHVLLYGLLGGVLIAGLRFIEYRWLVIEHSVRALQRQLKDCGVIILTEADESTVSPASFMIADPDGNTILVDQHV